MGALGAIAAGLQGGMAGIQKSQEIEATSLSMEKQKLAYDELVKKLDSDRATKKAVYDYYKMGELDVDPNISTEGMLSIVADKERKNVRKEKALATEEKRKKEQEKRDETKAYRTERLNQGWERIKSEKEARKASIAQGWARIKMSSDQAKTKKYQSLDKRLIENLKLVTGLKKAWDNALTEGLDPSMAETNYFTALKNYRADELAKEKIVIDGEDFETARKLALSQATNEIEEIKQKYAEDGLTEEEASTTGWLSGLFDKIKSIGSSAPEPTNNAISPKPISTSGGGGISPISPSAGILNKFKQYKASKGK